MKKIWRYFAFWAFLVLLAEPALAQSQTFKELHLVKRKETIFGIARDNGVTIQELLQANPEMNAPGYELKKGTYIKIPYPAGEQPSPVVSPSTKPTAMPVKSTSDADMRHRSIRVGVMLPLHNDNGDGKRMVEYYRGVLMACDSLRANGISADISAWNVPENADLNTFLHDPAVANCDVIIGPLYSKQVKAISDFAAARDIRLFIPFSINTQELYSNSLLFQVFQNGNQLNEAYVRHFMERFKGCHPVIVDCNDSTSTKGPFTAALRRKLEQEGISYHITNLRSSEQKFMQSFSTSQRNVVVLNTSRSQELNVAFAKLNGMLLSNNKIDVTMFGYTEWLMYTRSHLDNYYKFDTYIPSTYYMSPLSSRTEHFRKKYRNNFRQDMQNYHQRYAVTGFDHAYFLIKGLHLYGKRFTGAAGMVGYLPLQTPLHFERVEQGGLQNRAILFVHYTKDNRIETIHF